MAFNPLKFITGGIGSTVKEVASVFTANKEEQAKRDAEAKSAAMNQYGSEFNVHAKRNWLDSIVDGANRLVRPLMAYSVMTFFALVIYDVDLGLQVVQSLALVPSGMWALLSIIVTFYFAGRLQLKGQMFTVSKGQIATHKAMGDLRKDRADEVSPDEYVNALKDNKKKLTNAVLAEWNRRNDEGKL